MAVCSTFNFPLPLEVVEVHAKIISRLISVNGGLVPDPIIAKNEALSFLARGRLHVLL